MTDDPADEGRGRPSTDYRAGTSDVTGLATLLGRMSRQLEAETSLDDTLKALVAAAVAAIPGADAGGITEIQHHGRQVDVRYATDKLVVDLDTAQEHLGEGPCMDAAYLHRTVRVNDFETDSRWPAFAVRARQQGMRSMLAIQLYVQGDDLGALNMYSRRAHAFDDESEQVGLLFATHAAIAMSGARREQQLNVAVSGRDIIGQAKGILMERYKITADQAFAVLVRASSQSNLKLRDVADTLAESGEVPRC